MRKIKYPFTNETQKREFLNKYYDSISPKIPNHVEVCNKVKEIDLNWDLKKLLTADFIELVEFSKNKGLEPLSKYFKFGEEDKSYLYSSLQSIIADFFISESVNIKSCFYCNIEYTNPFNQFIEYKSVDEFILKATLNEWQEFLTVEKGKAIYEKVKELGIQDLQQLKKTKINGIAGVTLNKVNLLEINNLKCFRDHFTFDHFIPKSKFTFLSLSFFNLIPSCYSCNSRFKGQREFDDLEILSKVCPSSEDYIFDKSIKFTLLFDDVKLTNLLGDKEINTFIDMFRLKGRYEYHKTKAEEMVKKRKVYSDSQIKEIARLLKRDEQSIKEDLFGNECFMSKSNNEPFEKYKQDIAEQLGLWE